MFWKRSEQKQNKINYSEFFKKIKEIGSRIFKNSEQIAKKSLVLKYSAYKGILFGDIKKFRTNRKVLKMCRNVSKQIEKKIINSEMNKSLEKMIMKY